MKTGKKFEKNGKNRKKKESKPQYDGKPVEKEESDP